jgi:regulator of sigma E protease
MDFIITILSLGFVVFIHECGHFLFAKLSGVRVFEFSVGLGPKLCSFSKNETIYSIRILPLGGFVKLAGMDDSENADYNEDENYLHKSFLSKFSIIIAGPLMNILLSFVLFIIIFSSIGKTSLLPLVESVLENSPAYNVGLKKGDTLLELNGNLISNVETDMINVIGESGGSEQILTIERDDEVLTILVLPELLEGHSAYKIGVSLTHETLPIGFIESISTSGRYLVTSTALVFESFALLFSDEFSLEYLSGPVGIIQIASHVYDSGFIPFLNFMAFISLMLGIVNLLPIPIFDGGHIFFLCLEKLRGRPLSKKIELILNNISIAFLLTMMFVVIINDIVLWKDRVESIKGLMQHD